MIDFVSQIFEKTTRANPQAFYARMPPVFNVVGPVSGNTFWFLTRYEDCIAALKDPRFGKEFRKHLTPEQLKNYPPPDPVFDMMNRNMLFVDPPDHTRLRTLVHKAFTPRMIENLRPRIAQIADDLLNRMAQDGEADLIESYAFPLPITVIAEMLGVPAEERDQFRTWTKAMLFGSSEMDTMNAGMQFIAYCHEMFDQRRADPHDDLISALVQAENEGDKLNAEELLGMTFLLLVAGHETTVNLIGNGILSLLQNSEQMTLLREKPDLISAAIEEMLRYNGPIECATNRWAFEDVEIGGQVIRHGDQVLAALIAANRDPVVFENPDMFDITRPNNGKHIAFGHGIHYCLGAPLARLEGAIAINTLLARFPNLQMATPVETLEWNDSFLLHGMKSFPVKF